MSCGHVLNYLAKQGRMVSSLVHASQAELRRPSDDDKLRQRLRSPNELMVPAVAVTRFVDWTYREGHSFTMLVARNLRPFIRFPAPRERLNINRMELNCIGFVIAGRRRYVGESEARATIRSALLTERTSLVALRLRLRIMGSNSLIGIGKGALLRPQSIRNNCTDPQIILNMFNDLFNDSDQLGIFTSTLAPTQVFNSRPGYSLSPSASIEIHVHFIMPRQVASRHANDPIRLLAT
ncbi:hypothetical protein F4780DRAFT_41541 [Xylariomycetidae sp. FL0641]|nr:hypothetical protein F4780DRAFT_41541 [Xylariomycetidae sp. FL0641]